MRNAWEKKTGMNGVKFQIRPYNDSTLVLRMQNNHDEGNVMV
jgi:hypothetical protein